MLCKSIVKENLNFVFDIDGKTIDISIIEALNELSKCRHEIIFVNLVFI